MKQIKLYLAILFMGFLFVGNNVYASFPVETASTEVTVEVESNDLSSPAATKGGDVMWIALVLWLVLGGFAAHRWYAGKPVGWNILFILTGGGLFVWALVDLVMIFTGAFFE